LRRHSNSPELGVDYGDNAETNFAVDHIGQYRQGLGSGDNPSGTAGGLIDDEDMDEYAEKNTHVRISAMDHLGTPIVYNMSTDKFRSRELYLSNLPADIEEGELEQHFSKHGRIKDIRIAKDTMSGRPLGFGFITYFTIKDTIAAFLALRLSWICGRVFTIAPAKRHTGSKLAVRSRARIRGPDIQSRLPMRQLRQDASRNGGSRRNFRSHSSPSQESAK